MPAFLFSTLGLRPLKSSFTGDIVSRACPQKIQNSLRYQPYQYRFVSPLATATTQSSTPPASRDTSKGSSALLLVDHGSRRPAANALLEQLADRIRQRLSDSSDGSSINVVTAHMEMATPTITEGFSTCVKQGAKHVIVMPFFLAPGRHATQDIPRMIQEAAEQHDGVTWRIADVLGADGKMVDVVMERTGLDAGIRQQ